jgi:hypothetical protein
MSTYNENHVPAAILGFASPDATTEIAVGVDTSVVEFTTTFLYVESPHP